jgi:hypothetical protein
MQIDLQADKAMLETARAPHVRRPWLQLLSAVMQLAGGKAELLRHSEQPWASVTFSGSRHKIALAFTGSEAAEMGEEFIAALPEHEFEVPRQIVADAAVLAVEHVLVPEVRIVVEIELLLLEEG